MISIVTQGLVDPKRQYPINISAALDLLRTRQDPYSVRLLDALIQFNQMFMVLWRAVQSPDEILLDTLTAQDASGKTVTSLGPNSAQDGQLQLIAGGAGTSTATMVPDKLTFVTPQGTLKIDASANPVVIEFVPSGGATMQIKMPTGSQVVVNANKVLTDRQATVATVAGTAGATYTATEQGIINNLVTAVNALIARLQGMGTIA